MDIIFSLRISWRRWRISADWRAPANSTAISPTPANSMGSCAWRTRTCDGTDTIKPKGNTQVSVSLTERG